MLVEETIREKIRDEVLDTTGKKVRNIFFVTASTNGRSVYAIVGNNGHIFGLAIMSATLEIEDIIV